MTFGDAVKISRGKGGDGYHMVWQEVVEQLLMVNWLNIALLVPLIRSSPCASLAMAQAA